jgi:ribonucleoside-diphosphate reductase alpha chain
MELNAFKWLNENQLAYDIWNKKYRVNNEDFEHWITRVSGGNEEIEQLILEKKFIFGGRILASRGIDDAKATLSNCFVVEPPEDNIESIFDCAKKMARTYSYGGGCGTDVSKLRPNMSKVNNSAKTTSGATSFMELYSYVTKLIGQAGRRGALMLTIDCHHPDLVEFINLKTDLNACTGANISIRVTDDFMNAVQNNETWVMKFTVQATGEVIEKCVSAKELFRLIAQRNWEMAEPGLIYWDTVCNYRLDINTPNPVSTNPCSEIPLQSGGSCLLGSINLEEFVYAAFSDDAYLAWDELEDTVVAAVHALNEVLDEGLEKLPLEEQAITASFYRPIGLGTMGMANMLIRMGYVYGQQPAIEFLEDVYKFIAKIAIQTSSELAAQTRQTYHGFSKDIKDSEFLKNILNDIEMDDILEKGLYNSQILTCAPTGSIGTMFETSTGVEPLFALSYTRKTVGLTGSDEYYQVESKIVKDYRRVTGLKEDDKLPVFFKTAPEIAPIDRIKTQAVLQKYIDNAISSTINLPKEATIDDIEEIYMQAWGHGLKGVTVYRQGCQREGILTTEKPVAKIDSKVSKRPKELKAKCHSVTVKGDQYTVFVGLLEDKPYEVFVTKQAPTVKVKEHEGVITKESKMHYSFSSDYIQIDNIQDLYEGSEEKSATIYVSMLMRHGVDLEYIIKTAKKTNPNISSFTSAMCRVLSKYVATASTSEKCPECGSPLTKEGGCTHCQNCGWSKCS